MTHSAPSDPQNWGSLGDALLEMGKYESAQEAFQKMLAIRPNIFSYNRVAYYRFITGDIEGGIAMMTDAVKAGARYPENKAWCLVELGNMYFKTGRWPDAERAYTEALETFPSSHAAHAGLGSVQAAQGKLPQAIDSYKHAQSITPMVQYAGVLYDLYAASGKKAEAQQQADLVDVIADMNDHGFTFDAEWFRPHWEFRFPLAGTVAYEGVELQLRTALEPWNVMAEDAAESAKKGIFSIISDRRRGDKPPTGANSNLFKGQKSSSKSTNGNVTSIGLLIRPSAKSARERI